MNNHNASCPECQMLLRDQGPSGDPWEQQILCPGCSSIYHVSCTIVGTERTWRRLGKHMEMWKCKRCFTEGSDESVIFSEHIEKLKNGKESTKNCDSDSRSKSSSEQLCAECLEKLRDNNGRLVRRIQCPDCLEAFHFSCTDIGDERVWQQIGNYRTMWKCKNCYCLDSNRIFNEKLKEVKQSLDIPVNFC